MLNVNCTFPCSQRDEGLLCRELQMWPWLECQSFDAYTYVPLVIKGLTVVFEAFCHRAAAEEAVS